ncbi:hypothetical protein BDZ45DRAFT_655642 [Acephala macrosclerotiorum]|nr:hypothetical protein BDZ45DRAFT_655642 [Acephala macrosclerotiorum]
MLTAQKIPRACQSCRLQLLSLFENGFTNVAVTTSTRVRYSTRPNVRARNLQPRHQVALRSLSTTQRRTEEPKSDLSEKSAQSAAEIESVVRQARQTFGETLPKDYLSTEEYVLYERLYGPPLRETKPEDLEYLPGEETSGDKARNVLLRTNEEGEYEELDYDPELGYSVLDEDALRAQLEQSEIEEAELHDAALYAGEEDGIGWDADGKEGLDETTIQVQGKNQREIDAIARLQRDMTEAMSKPVEEEEDDIDEEYEEEEEAEEEEEEDDGWVSSDSIRTHPHTMIGRSRTSPLTLNLPQKHIGLDASQHRMSEIEADAYLAAIIPGTYASVMSTLVEVRKRLGSQWIRDLILREGGQGPRVLDAGAGGAGVIAWREVLQAEWDVMKDEGLVEGEEVPHGKSTVLTGSNALRHRVSRFLDDTTFLPRLPDYVHASNSEAHLDGSAPQGRKAYDIILAPHTLFPLKEDFRRKNMVQNLWSLLDPNGGVLILIEKGLPRGFEAIAGARSLLLESHISSPGETDFENEIQSPESERARFTKKEEGMIIAPCTNHKNCPMYPVPGLSTGRKDFCHFPQRMIRPPFLQKVLGAKIRNHEDIKYSYIAVRRGVDARKSTTTTNSILQGEEATLQAFEGYEDQNVSESENGVEFNPLSLPRIILPSLKSRGHITLDLCTPSAKLERWIVPRSFSRAAYRDARKSKWGDLWALGAKTRTLRSPRLGRLGDEGGKVKGIREGKMGKGGKKVKKAHYDMVIGRQGFEGIKESAHQAKFVKREKRTKGGRVWKEAKPLGEDDF